MPSLHFTPIALSKQGPYARLYDQTELPASDYSITNLWAWAEQFGLQWRWTENLVWIRQTRPVPAYWAPIGNWNQVDWPEAMNGFSSGSIFIRVPEPLVALWKERLSIPFEVHDARGQWDYVYTIEDLVQLKGNRFHKKKNLLARFLKSYRFSYERLNEASLSKVRSMQEQWCAWRDCGSSQSLAAENRAVQRVLERWNELPGLLGGVLSVEDQLIAYTIAEPLTARMLAVHFEKAAPHVHGAYQAIQQMFLSRVDPEFLEVNREQDLDDEGLRQAKLSYHPCRFLKKYTVVLK